MSRAQKIKTQPPTTTTTLPLEEYILDESIPEYMDDIQLSCACVNHSGHITQCAYLNLRVPALSGDVRFTVCVCGVTTAVSDVVRLVRVGVALYIVPSVVRFVHIRLAAVMWQRRRRQRR